MIENSENLIYLKDHFLKVIYETCKPQFIDLNIEDQI